MSTNFEQFNPGSVNQENDAQYLVDTTRTGGAATDGILPSPLFNKFAYQQAQMTAALAQMLANKGYVVSDANFSTLVAILAHIQTSADIPILLQTVAFASTVALDASVASGFYLLLTGNVTASTLSGPAVGEKVIFAIQQDGTGNRTLAWPTNVYGNGAISLVSGSISIQEFLVLPDNTLKACAPMMIWTGGTSIAGAPAVVSISSTGAVSSAYAELTEKVDCTGGAITRTLYTAVGNQGRKVHVNKIDSSGNAITIVTSAGQTINGVSSLVVIRQFASAELQSDGTNWIII